MPKLHTVSNALCVGLAYDVECVEKGDVGQPCQEADSGEGGKVEAVADGDATRQINDICDAECRVAADLVGDDAKDEAAEERAEEEHCLREGASPCIVADPVHLGKISE